MTPIRSLQFGHIDGIVTLLKYIYISDRYDSTESEFFSGQAKSRTSLY